MSRRWLVFLLVPVVAAVIGGVLAAASNQRDLVWDSNAFAGEAIPVPRRVLACMTNVNPSETFTGVRFGVAGAGALPGPRVQVTVEDPARRPLARAVLPRGYRGQAVREVDLDRPVAAAPGLRVCFRNRGKRTLLLYGTPAAARGRQLTLRAQPKNLALQMQLTRPSRSALASLPSIVRRASVLRPDPIGPWSFWLLGGLVIVVVPLLCVLAVARAGAEDAERS